MTAQHDRSALLDEAREDEQPKQPVHLTTRAGLAPIWEPIETAPKDGTEILLYAPPIVFEGKTVPERVTYGHWLKPSDIPRIKYQEGFAPEEEWDDFEPYWMSWDGGFTEEHSPTHWMPIPAAPKDGGVVNSASTAQPRYCGNCADGVPGGPDNCSKCGRQQQYSHWTPAWRKFPDVPAPVGPVLVTSASKVVWMADFSQSENVWRFGSGRDMVKLPPDAITHWMPLPVAAGLDGVSASDPRDRRAVEASSEQAGSNEHDFGSRIEHLEALVRRQQELLMQARETAQDLFAQEAA